MACELVRDVCRPGEQEVARALAQGRHGEAGIVAAVDHDRVAERQLDRVPEADPGEAATPGRRDQQSPRGRRGAVEHRSRLAARSWTRT